MNFAIPFTTKFNYWDEPSIEININYKPKVKELDDFIGQYQNHRINLIFGKSETSWGAVEFHNLNEQRDIPIIQALREKYPNTEIVIQLPPVFKPDLETYLSDSGIPHYYFIFANNWDTFNGLAKLDVTDIYITGELGFWLPLVKENAKGKKIRAICNISQADDFPRNMFKYDSLHTFFIRPEDIDEYAKYIDTFEFAETAKHTYNVFYDLYCYKKRWAGPLKEIIKGYDGEEDSAYILPHFGSTRTSCRKKCGWMGCYLCFNIANLGKVLKQNQIGIIYKNKNLQYNKEDEKSEKSENTD